MNIHLPACVLYLKGTRTLGMPWGMGLIHRGDPFTLQAGDPVQSGYGNTVCSCPFVYRLTDVAGGLYNELRFITCFWLVKITRVVHGTCCTQNTHALCKIWNMTSVFWTVWLRPWSRPKKIGESLVWGLINTVVPRDGYISTWYDTIIDSWESIRYLFRYRFRYFLLAVLCYCGESLQVGKPQRVATRRSATRCKLVERLFYAKVFPTAT